MKNILDKIKIDQIAISTRDSFRLIETLKQAGLTEWIKDDVKATGNVRDVENVTNKAKLFFNYQMGIEFEVLEYIEGKNWHDDIRIEKEGMENFLSHIGFHIHDKKEIIAGAGETVIESAEEQLQEIKRNMLNLGYNIAQEVWTDSHSNQYLQDQKRKYHYIIFDTRKEFGFDVKLIVRRENA